jgi:hypothetical protein
MTWSLLLSNGDFAPSSGTYNLARNETKLAQDLRCWILEKTGTDIYHEGYGSDLDSETKSVLGLPTDLAISEIEDELRRIIGLYQKRQVERAKTDQATLGKLTLEKGEILLALRDISFRQVEDKLQVTITIQTGSGENINIGFTV